MDKRQKDMLVQMGPVLGFIVVMFLSETTDWMPATKVVLSTFASLMVFFIMVADLKTRAKGVVNIKKMNIFTPLLSILFLLVFASGFLDWNRVLPQFQRLAIILFILLIYFIILFRAMRFYLEYLVEIKKNGK